MEGRESGVRVLLVDDHPDGREGMREIVTEDGFFEVAGAAASGEEAIELMPVVRPDLVLMDINMPGMGGLEATRRLKQEWPAVKIVMVTVSDDITHLFEAIRRGAQGYLLKNLAPSAWMEYLRAVALDEAPMSKELAFRLLQEFAAGKPHSDKAPAGPAGSGTEAMTTPLTGREKEVLERVATGASNREVAAALGVSEHTVKNHLKNILQKLHLDNRVQLTRYAFEQGWIDRRQTFAPER
ncbi:response regulator transcription factor [Paenibacillus sp. N4]|uniref:response regulator n=1 Tax=Paenibacillus vietnamensis TaxID=2590547 RepID=UPI001CD0C332|nr:response regulator transcription factor [Paenibacillus vietnamensis]MCA0758045.1 response regulator transcription factor [Paenibacillus vietnamensis]